MALRSLRRTARHALTAAAVAVMSGCASQAYDPVPSRNAPVAHFAFDTPLGLEPSYRRLHERLEACVTTGHRVQPRYEHAPPRAWIMVVTGLGLDRYSFAVNLFEARFDLEPEPGGTRVSVAYLGDEMAALARAAERWLVHGSSDCRA